MLTYKTLAPLEMLTSSHM